MFKYYRERQTTQRQLSEETGIPIRTFQAYEIGTADINGASLETILKIAIALSIPAYKVVDATNERGKRIVKLLKQEREIRWQENYILEYLLLHQFVWAYT